MFRKEAELTKTPKDFASSNCTVKFQTVFSFRSKAVRYSGADIMRALM